MRNRAPRVFQQHKGPCSKLLVQDPSSEAFGNCRGRACGQRWGEKRPGTAALPGSSSIFRAALFPLPHSPVLVQGLSALGAGSHSCCVLVLWLQEGTGKEHFSDTADLHITMSVMEGHVLSAVSGGICLPPELLSRTCPRNSL